MSIAALETYLSPIQSILDRKDVSEISMNGPGEIWVEVHGDMERHDIPEFDLEHLKALARLVAQSTDQAISEETPLLSATLPDGFRIQAVFPPACQSGSIGISIRKQAILDFDLDKYEELGAFQDVAESGKPDSTNADLQALLKEGRIKEFIILAVKTKKNMIISGGTSTGKTTFMNALLKEIDPSERIITCEDAQEIQIPHIPNRLHLLSSRGGQGRANVTTQDLIEACLRLRPDRIMVGELRGVEAFSFLRAVNTGHPGSISTIHADTPKLALEQLTLMVMQGGYNITKDQVKEYVLNVIDIIVQLKRGDKGRRFVSEIFFNAK